MNAVVVVRPTDRWVSRLVAAIVEVGSARPVVVGTLHEAEVAIRGRSPELIVFDPAVVGTDLPVVLPDQRSRMVGWLGSRSSPVVATLLTAGAADVLDASMGDEELVARLRRVLAGTDVNVGGALHIGRLTVDAGVQEATWDDAPLPLTRREIEVLQVLAAAHDQPVRRKTLYRLVWGWTMPRGDRTVDVNVKRLRDKLARAGVRVEIHTHPNVGYRLRVLDTDDAVTGL